MHKLEAKAISTINHQLGIKILPGPSINMARLSKERKQM